MDEVEPGPSSSGVAASETLADLLPTAATSQQPVVAPVPGARNYGYPDEFMMYMFKIDPCFRTDKHPRGSCPYAHPGDVARRRHPSRYQALLCPEVRAKKVCPRADECQCSHSAFEFWLHPDRYRTSMCEKGLRCSRPVCFFAHTPEELRQLPAGLKPAAPDEHSSSSGRRTSGGTNNHPGGNLQPGGSSIMPWHEARMPTGSAGYVQQQAQQPLQQVVLQPAMQLMPVVPAAGGAPAHAPVGYVPVLQPGMEGSTPVQYGQVPGQFYTPEQQVVMLPAGQQYMMQSASVVPSHHHQQPVIPMAEVMQQFQGLAVSSRPMGGHYEQAPHTNVPRQWAGTGSSISSSDQRQVTVMTPGGLQMQYMQQAQVVYVPSSAGQGTWQQQYMQHLGMDGPYATAGSYHGHGGAYAGMHSHQHTSNNPGRHGVSSMLSPAQVAAGTGTPTSAAGVVLAPMLQQQGQQLPNPPGMLEADALGVQHHALSSVVGANPGTIAGEHGLNPRLMPQAGLGAFVPGTGMPPQQQHQQNQHPALDRPNWLPACGP